MANLSRISVEHLDNLDELEDRHRTDPLDPSIPVLLARARVQALRLDTGLQEIAVIARRGHDAPRRKQIKADRHLIRWNNTE